MSSAWAFAFLLLYPALQVPLLWLVVNRYDLRNDDGPRDPVGYSMQANAADAETRADANGDVAPDERTPTRAGRCPDCGLRNDPVYEYCRDCLAGLS